MVVTRATTGCVPFHVMKGAYWITVASESSKAPFQYPRDAQRVYSKQAMLCESAPQAISLYRWPMVSWQFSRMAESASATKYGLAPLRLECVSRCASGGQRLHVT